MKQTTRNAIAGLLSASAAVLSALAAEFTGDAPEAQPEAPKERKKKTPASSAPAETQEATTPETSETVEGAKTYEELKAAIEPFVKAGQGPEVKKLIAKHDPAGNPPSIKTMPAQNHTAFLKDLEALSY